MSNLKIELSKVKTLEELSNILNKSKAKISFFGRTYIKNKNFSSNVLISFVVKKALSILQHLLKEWNYSLKDREFITQIMQKIDKFYLKIDEKLHKSNFITKIFYCLRHLFTIFDSTRKKWEDLPDLCNLYSLDQFKTAFPYYQTPKEPEVKYQNLILYLAIEK